MPLSAIPSDPFRDEKAANKGRRDKYKFKMTRTIPDNNSLRGQRLRLGFGVFKDVLNTYTH